MDTIRGLLKLCGVFQYPSYLLPQACETFIVGTLQYEKTDCDKRIIIKHDFDVHF